MQAIRIKPDYAEAHNNLGIAYLGVGNKNTAIEQYKILKNLDMDFAAKLLSFIHKTNDK